MLKVEYDLSERFEVFNDSGFSIVLSSNTNESMKVVTEIIMKLFNEKDVIFKAIGHPETINSIPSYINEKYFIYEGDVRKFSIKKYPEIHMKISCEDNLIKAISIWTSIIFEKRYLFVLKKDCLNIVNNLLDNNVYKEDENLLFTSLWPYLDCIIKNSRDTDEDNTFIIIAKNDKIKEIKNLIEAFK